MNFRKLLTATQKGQVIVPLIRAALYDPKFKDFHVRVGGFEQRDPDGFFHPSEHPLWPERMLYYYLTAPDKFVLEHMDPQSVMAVTQGQFWHTLITRVGLDAGVLTAGEVPVQDDVTGARGHMDGTLTDEAFEFKTMRPTKVMKLPDVPVSDPALLTTYVEREPVYYAQAQEYMRLSGYAAMRTLILSMEYPFDMREIVIPRNEVMIGNIRDKYLTVRQAVADKREPMPCCGLGSKVAKQCPARLTCPIGMAS